MNFELTPPKDTRELLLQVAFLEIFESGLRGASIEKICKKAKLTKGAFFHYFPSKKRLTLSVIDEVISKVGFRRYILPMLEKEDPIDGLKAVVDYMISVTGSYELHHGCILLNLVHELGTREPE